MLIGNCLSKFRGKPGLFSLPRTLYFWPMYSRQEASRLRQDFWTRFGQYMTPVLSADGERINWVNYRTGEPQLNFRMDAGPQEATVALVLSHRDAGMRELYYQQLLELKMLFEATAGADWHWIPVSTTERGTVSKVEQTLTGVSVFRPEDWPALISFFKMRIMALDAFWSQAKYAFEALR